MNKNMSNRGTGAGGGQTNANGLPFEEETSMRSEFVTIEIREDGRIVDVESPNGTRYRTGAKGKYHEIMGIYDPNYADIHLLHGTKEPDEYYITEKSSYVIEKKTQSEKGSVCEKLQTAPMKQRRLQRMYPNIQINYIYILSPFFRERCPAELEELSSENIHYFFSDSGTYKQDVLLLMNAR